MKLFCFIFAVLYYLAGRDVIIILNSIPKGVTTHVQNKMSDFNRGYFFLRHPVYTRTLVLT